MIAAAATWVLATSCLAALWNRNRRPDGHNQRTSP